MVGCTSRYLYVPSRPLFLHKPFVVIVACAHEPSLGANILAGKLPRPSRSARYSCVDNTRWLPRFFRRALLAFEEDFIPHDDRRTPLTKRIRPRVAGCATAPGISSLDRALVYSQPGPRRKGRGSSAIGGSPRINLRQLIRYRCPVRDWTSNHPSANDRR